MAELVLPIAFWSSPTQNHSISVTHLTSDKKTLVTGGWSGKVCLWSLRSKPSSSENKTHASENLRLRCILTGHTTQITALASVTYDWKETVISVSADGTICLWNSTDGKCVHSMENLLMRNPTSIVVTPGGQYLACSGQHNYVEIVDLFKLKVRTRLLAHSNWIGCLYSCDLGPPGIHSPVLLSAGSDGIIQIWSLRRGDGAHPMQTICLDIGDPLSISLSPNFKTLLIVTANECILHTAKESREIMTVPCPDPGGWRGGGYVGNQAIVAWTKEGHAYLYALPRVDKAAPLSMSIPPDQVPVQVPVQVENSGSHNSIENLDIETMDVVIQPPKQQPSNWRSSYLKKVNVADKTGVQPVVIFCRNAEEDQDETILTHSGGIWGRILILGNSLGKVTIWILPPNPDQLESESRILPWAVATPADHWKSAVSKSMSMTNFFGNTPTLNGERESIHNKVTASIIFEELWLLILGYADGSIRVTRLPTADEKSLPQEAHEGAVTSLLSISDDKHPRLISGAADCTVKVWEISSINGVHTATLLWNFVQHTGPIVRLFQPPVTELNNMTNVDNWKNCFFSISKDRTIALYSLDTMHCKNIFGVHPTDISRVKWQLEQEYLSVECEDGSVSIWEMGSGELEGIVHGELARDIMSQSKNILPDNEDYFSEALHNSITSFTISIKDESPVQILSLNIKKLVRDLDKSLKNIEPQATQPAFHSPKQKKRLPVQIYSPDMAMPPVHLPAYTCFTYLLPWGMDPEIDEMCKTSLGLLPPNPPISFAIKGYAGKISLWVPSALEVGRWQCSEYLTALHTLAAVSYTTNLLAVEFFRNACSKLLAYYCHSIPENCENFVDPSLYFLGLFWRDPIEDITQAARAIFVATADRLSTERRQAFAKSWASKLEKESNSKSQAILVLAILGSNWPDSMDQQLTARVTNELLKLLQQDSEGGALRIAAAELLGKGFTIWRQYITNVDMLIQHLFALSLLSDPPNISATAHHALMLIGTAEPKQFVVSLGQYILEVHYSDNMTGKPLNTTQHAAAILTLGSLVKQDPISLWPLLPRLVETVVRSLDPHVPYLRESCLVSTTRVLHSLVKLYPVVSFHQESQRLAVGTQDAKIVVYDLKTATRMYVLEGHAGPISALSFAGTGKSLASYSVADSEVKFWKTETGFLNFLTAQPTCLRSYRVDKVDKKLSQMELLDGVRLKWTSATNVTLVREWEGTLTFSSK